MIRYICETCGVAFDEPHRRQYSENLGEFNRTYIEETCPVCGGDHFAEADLCPQCGIQHKRMDEILCKACRGELLRRFIDFADTLTEEEENQLDNWLDGVSVQERRCWA